MRGLPFEAGPPEICRFFEGKYPEKNNRKWINKLLGWEMGGKLKLLSIFLMGVKTHFPLVGRVGGCQVIFLFWILALNFFPPQSGRVTSFVDNQGGVKVVQNLETAVRKNIEIQQVARNNFSIFSQEIFSPGEDCIMIWGYILGTGWNRG